MSWINAQLNHMRESEAGNAIEIGRRLEREGIGAVEKDELATAVQYFFEHFKPKHITEE